MSDYFPTKDNEFIAWYPVALRAEHATKTWEPRRAAYYVHIPFCTAICDYCGFAVQSTKGAKVERYLDALKREIERYAKSQRLAGHRFSCGHFGGGTPSTLDGRDLMAIKQLIDASFDTTPDAEVTVEVNPVSFTVERAQSYRDHGVNRISFGAQSFNDETLRTIGRPHRRSDVQETLDVIRHVGFANYSIDIMYGVPGQTMEQLREDLTRAAGTGATHLSTFRVEIIPFTVLKLREAAHQLPPRLSLETLNEMDDLVTEILTEAGYREYGAFNFAKPGFESVHNAIAFMAPQGEYIGFGNSAWSFISDHIYCNIADVQGYEDAILANREPIAFARHVSALDSMSRYFVLGLKFFRVSREGFRDLYGMEPEQVFRETLEELCAAGMLILEGDDYRLTRLGRHYVNNVSKAFFRGDNRGQRQHVQFVPTITPAQISHYARLRSRAEAGLDIAE